MSREITRDRQGDFKLKWPCRNPRTGRWCWCTKNSIKCRTRGVRIRDFSGSASANASGSETVKQAGLGAGIFTMAIVLGGAIYILSKISKQMDTK